MAQYNSLNVKLSNSQPDKLKSAKTHTHTHTHTNTHTHKTDVVLRLSSNMIDNSDNKINFPHELLLTNRQVANIGKAFANNLSTDIKLSKSQLSKMIESGGFLGRLAINEKRN